MEARPIRPYQEASPLNPQPFDPRTSIFIPDRSIEDRHIVRVSPRKVRLIGAKVYASAAQSVATGSDTGKTFNTAAFDTAGMFSDSADSLTVPYAGIWLVTAYVEWASSGAGNLRKAVLQVDGGNQVTQNHNPVTGSPTQCLITFPASLSAGAALTVNVRQDSGGNLDVNGGEANNFLSAVLLGTI